MRSFEILTLGMLLLALIARFWRVERRPSWTYYLPGAVILLILIHLVMEGYRWQMVPTYALAILLFVLSLLRLLKKKSASPVGRGRKILNGIGTALGFVALAMAAVLPALFPVFQLPEPQGPYRVGVRNFELTDHSRLGVLFSAADEPRRLAVRVWYPAETTDGLTRRPYATDEELRTTFPWLAAEELSFPSFFFSHLNHVTTSSYENAQVLDDGQPLPVVFFSHGLLSYASQSTALMEHLASHGYVVFSVTHTYDAAPVVFPNGDVIALPEAPPASDEPSEEATRLFLDSGPKFMEGKSYDERYDGALGQVKLKWVVNDRILLESPAVWLADRLFVVEALSNGEAPETVADVLTRADFTRVGHMGMSYGGSTAAATCYADSRCAAAINLDGSDFHHSGINVDIPVPFMMLYSDSMNGFGVVEDSGNRPFGFNDFAYERFETAGLRDDIIRLHVKGATHFGVSDLTLLARGPLHDMLTGPIEGDLMVAIVNDFVLGFLDKYLLGITNDFPQEQFTEYADDVMPHDVSGVREWWLSKSAEEQAVLEQKLGEAQIAPTPK